LTDEKKLILLDPAGAALRRRRNMAERILGKLRIPPRWPIR
jgi:hypothetical protein